MKFINVGLGPLSLNGRTKLEDGLGPISSQDGPLVRETGIYIIM